MLLDYYSDNKVSSVDAVWGKIKKFLQPLPVGTEGFPYVVFLQEYPQPYYNGKFDE